MVYGFDDFITDYFQFYISRFLIVIIAAISVLMMLIFHSKIGKKDIRPIIALPIFLMVLSIFETADVVLRNSPVDAEGLATYPVYIRQVCSIICYMIRPCIAASAFYVLFPEKLKKLWPIFYIPIFINAVIYARCFFPNGFFRINEYNGWDRPYPEVRWMTNLGFITSAIYGVGIIFFVFKELIARRYMDSLSILVTLLCCFLGFYLESEFDIAGLGASTCAAGTLIYLIFILVKTLKVDALTDIYNRTAYNNFPNKDKRVNGVISLLVDNIKDINDEFGHERGDEILCNVAQIIGRKSGKEMFTFRLDGAQFTCLCLNMNEQQIKELADLISKEVNEITEARIAIGVAYREDPNETYKAIHDRSDAFMHKMKRLLKM